MDVLRRPGAERLGQGGVQRLVGTMVVPPNHVCDPEVDVVNDACKVVGRRPVLAQERHALEALGKPRSHLAVPVGAVALPHGPLVPLDPEPAQVVEDRLLAAGHVASRIGVVDPQQHRAAKVAVGDRAERISDVERARRARSEADLHASRV